LPLHWDSTDRSITDGSEHLAADFRAQNLGGRIEGGYHFGTVLFGVTPCGAGAQLRNAKALERVI
jgi:hypothetical protein